MNKIEIRLLHCLADPELTDSEFGEFVDLLHRKDLKDIISAADHLRHVSRNILRDVSRSRVPEGLARHIHSLLIKEGRMTPTVAARSLLSELRDEPVPSRKWSIRSVLEFALRFASESEVIAAAQRALAKQSKTESKHAWTLRKPLN
jgi:hypothetical protein